MLLAFDTGNTNVVMGVYEGDRLFASWRFATDARRTADEYAVLCRDFFATKGLGFEAIDQIIISSVVPDLTRTLVRMCEVYFGVAPLLVEAGVKTGLKIRYENPKELGADRIVNAVSGIERYGAPLIIVDFGTATTFCAINADKEYLGGAITAVSAFPWRRSQPCRQAAEGRACGAGSNHRTHDGGRHAVWACVWLRRSRRWHDRPHRP